MTAKTPRTYGDAVRPTGPPRVVVVAAGPPMRDRIGTALEGGESTIFAELEEVAGVVDLASEDSTVIVFTCDVEIPREMAALRRLCREARRTAVVVISPPSTGIGVRRAFDAGACAVVFEPELDLALATAIHAVTIGQSILPRKVRAGIQRPAMSHRERQVLALVRDGLTNAEIAKCLFLAESTVKSHLSSIFTKLGVRSRKEVAAAFLDVDPALNGTLAPQLESPASRARPGRPSPSD
jgi:DNA-binding NarL/FixJ family response regulator